MDISNINTSTRDNHHSGRKSLTECAFGRPLFLFPSFLLIVLTINLLTANSGYSQLDPTDLLLIITDHNIEKITEPQITQVKDNKKPLLIQPADTDANNNSPVDTAVTAVMDYETTTTVTQQPDAISERSNGTKYDTAPEKIFFEQNNQLIKQLQYEDISPVDYTDNHRDEDLQKIIEQLQCIELKPNKQTADSKPAVNDTQTSLAADVASDDVSEHNQIKTAADSPYEKLHSRTLEIIEQALQQPKSVNNSFELAEILFLSNHLKSAGVFYQQALKATDPNEPDPTHNREWIMFQTGNCLRDTDPNGAIEVYTMQISQYPDSPWSQLAKTRIELINWLKTNSPQTLINTDKPKTSGNKH